MRNVIAASLSALLLMGCAATPDQETATVPARGYDSKAEAAEASRDDDVICTYEKRIGSHMKQAVCMTKKQREQLTEESQDEARRANRSMGYGNNSAEPKL